ncbi:MAG: pseudouridine synthase [Pseudomonadota bacterium]
MPRKPRVTYASRRQSDDGKPNPVGLPSRAGPKGTNNAQPGFKKRGASATKKSVIAKAAVKAAAASSKPKPKRTKAPKATGPQRLSPRTSVHSSGPSVTTPMRIAKAMARAGLCSRRDAERWIDEGRVRVNGKVLETAALEVGPKDKILVDGQPLPAAEPPRLWRLHKERGTVTTVRDPQGRPTVFANLPDDLPRVIAVGRLDFNTEGLLLLTNDGELARHLELPSTGWLRRYRVRARGRIGQTELNALKDGITVEGIKYGPIEASVDTASGANQWLNVGLREGKNREVRKVLAHLKLEVNRLIRVSYGPFQLLDLPPGAVEHVRRKTLLAQLGPRTAKTFGLNDEDDEVQTRKPTQRQSSPTARKRTAKAKP